MDIGTLLFLLAIGMVIVNAMKADTPGNQSANSPVDSNAPPSVSNDNS